VSKNLQEHITVRTDDSEFATRGIADAPIGGNEARRAQTPFRNVDQPGPWHRRRIGRGTKEMIMNRIGGTAIALIVGITLVTKSRKAVWMFGCAFPR